MAMEEERKKTQLDYPASHSIDTYWFAVDKDGRLACICSGEEGTWPADIEKSNDDYEMTDDAWVCVRTSGTEPKVKFYFGIKGTSLADADAKAEDMRNAVNALVDTML